MSDSFKIWFTGTRKGMTEKQKASLKEFLLGVGVTQFQHGDCLGADAESHDIVKLYLPSVKVIIRPPKNPVYRAFCQDADIVMEPEEYLVRNHLGVDDTDMVIATPYEDEEQRRSGTWATIRYAHKKKKPVIIVTPRGLLKNYPL